MADFAAESGHWYEKITGTPKYTYTNKKGEIKNTTLREARKEGWVPSVTHILSLAYKSGLENWKQEQTILACLTMPRIENEPEADYIARLKADSKAQAQKAAARGTEIHGWVEQGFRLECPPEGQPFYVSAIKTIVAECGHRSWSTEKSFATDRYGGKIDLQNVDYLIDIKTTEKDVADLTTWPEHAQQLSAYDRGLGNPGRKCGILYINYKAESRLIWIEPKELEKGWKCFQALLDFYMAKNDL